MSENDDKEPDEPSSGPFERSDDNPSEGDASEFGNDFDIGGDKPPQDGSGSHDQRSLPEEPSETKSDPSPHFPKDDSERIQEAGEAAPATIGRYKIDSILGSGGFGEVYLAQDPRLARQVAIKVPRQDRRIDETVWKGFLTEGRAVARMRHEAIVAVFDVDKTEGGIPYVVMEYVEGRTLGKFVKEEKPDLLAKLKISRQIAEALRYAHKQSVIHRDLKPANILIDDDDRPRIMDFGLALRVNQPIDRIPTSAAGTLAYMAPEQVLAENHRIDGRTDIWAMGVIMYWLFTGQRPFFGRRTPELVREICDRDPKPMRQLNDKLPPEIDRICSKCLQKLMRDRYSTAADLVSDLSYLIERHSLYRGFSHDVDSDPRERDSGGSGTNPGGTHPRGPEPTDSDPRGRDESTIVRVVPKGLRSFDENDSEFFRELLPGPVDRFGMPETIRFWVSKISDQKNPLSTGLIYGPSGCGKSSFVKAGLLPQLTEEHLCVYMECSVDRTESELFKRLERVIRERDIDARDLTELIIGLRTGRYTFAGKRLLIVLDQFEQWLIAGQNTPDANLVRALRHVDGDVLQLLVMVRDDFWMQIQHFFKLLEVDIHDGRNALALPLFTKRHAAKVLRALGRGYNALGKDEKLSKQQKNFISEAVESLSRNDRVICAHLSLFADLMKNRTWTSGEFSRLGGWEGVGIRFLEEAFGEETAAPGIRPHTETVRAVLSALLPARGEAIKGAGRSRQELESIACESSGRSSMRGELDIVVDDLDNGKRLITRLENFSGDYDTEEETRYQLAHDVLVEPIRNWLNLKQSETWKGRAQIRAADLAGRWAKEPENRNLPALSEYVQIATGVPRRLMDENQRSMFASATKYFAVRAILVFSVFVALTAIWAVWKQGESVRLGNDIDTLLSASWAADELLLEMRRLSVHRVRTIDELERRLDETSDSEARIRINLALAFLEPESKLKIRSVVDCINEKESSEYGRVFFEVLNACQGESREYVISCMVSAINGMEDSEAKGRLIAVLSGLCQSGLANGGDSGGAQVNAVDLLNARCEQRANPDLRTWIIHSLPDWGDMRKVLDLIEGELEKPGTLESGTTYSLVLAICVANSEGMLKDEQNEIAAITQSLHDSTYHSAQPGVLAASEVLLRQIQSGVRPTRLEIKQQNVRREMMGGEWYTFSHVESVTIAGGSCWFSSTAVTARQFKRFKDDSSMVADIEARGGNLDDLVYQENVDESADSELSVVSMVSLYGAMEFCNWLTSQSLGDDSIKYYEISYEGRKPTIQINEASMGFRLPAFETYRAAALAGADTEYHFGSIACENLKNFYGEFERNDDEPLGVGTKFPNELGIFGLTGSQPQWCSDEYDDRGYGVLFMPEQRTPQFNSTADSPFMEIGFHLVCPCHD